MQAASPALGKEFRRSNARSIAGEIRSGVWLYVKVHPPVLGVWCTSHYTSRPGQLEHPFEHSGPSRLHHLSLTLNEQRGARSLISQKNKKRGCRTAPFSG